jgi:hypothetical protein
MLELSLRRYDIQPNDNRHNSFIKLYNVMMSIDFFIVQK